MATPTAITPGHDAGAVITAWRGSHIEGLQLGALTHEEALELARPAMTYVREQLRQRLGHQVGQAYRRWLHPTADADPATGSCKRSTAAAAVPVLADDQTTRRGGVRRSA